MLDQFRASFLSASEFVVRAFGALERLSTTEYLRRRGADTKRLIEEVVPLAALLQHLWIPDRYVQCKFIGTDRGHDAEVRIAGPEVERRYLPPLLHVEVTTAVPGSDYLVREALDRGFTVLGGYKIERRKRRGDKEDGIVDRAVAVDVPSVAAETAELIRKAIVKKSRKNYAKPCALLVNATPRRRHDLQEWARVAREVAPHVDRERFHYVFVADWQRSVVFAV